MADKSSICSGMEFNKEEGSFTVKIPDLGKAILSVFEWSWPAVKWLFWPILAGIGLIRSIAEYPRETKRAAGYIGAWAGGVWGGLMAIGFFIALVGPDDITTPHFNWFCFITGYLGIALCLFSVKYLHDSYHIRW